MKFVHLQSQIRSPQYLCTYWVWWKSIDIYSSYNPETKILTDWRTYNRWTDGYTDNQCDIIIPRHYRVAVYKNVCSFCICKSYLHFFRKNTYDILLTRTINILTTNKFTMLMMLWTREPCLLFSRVIPFMIYWFLFDVCVVQLFACINRLLWMQTYKYSLKLPQWDELVWVEGLLPSQPHGVMTSVVNLPNHTFTAKAYTSK